MADVMRTNTITKIHGSNSSTVSSKLITGEKNSTYNYRGSKYSLNKIKKISETYYAGAKFCDHPDPILLPKPPEHWIISATCNKKLLC